MFVQMNVNPFHVQGVKHLSFTPTYKFFPLFEKNIIKDSFDEM